MTEPPARYPDFFIVGAPKCGTTALYAYLRQHPQIYMPFHKEPLFFGDDLSHRYGRMSTDEYLALFDGAGDGQRVGEASAWYLYSSSAADEIKAVSPSAQAIVLLRNPIDVMYAQHSQMIFSGQEDLDDFEDALAAEEDRQRGRRLPPGPIRAENLYYRRMVRFTEQLQRCFSAFGRDNVHVIVYDDFRRDTAGEYRRVLRFLDVDPAFVADFRPVNENKRVRHARLQQLIWNPPLLRPLIPWLRRWPLAHAVRSRLLEANSQRRRRDPMDHALRASLEAELADEVTSLGRLLGRDLSHWVQDHSVLHAS